jgi:hypothetical protein
MKSALKPPRLWLHRRQGWPFVVGLLVVSLLETVLATAVRCPVLADALGAGQPIASEGWGCLTAPVGGILPGFVSIGVWLALLWAGVALAAALYWTGHVHSETSLTYGLLAIYVFALFDNVWILVDGLVVGSSVEPRGLLVRGALIWIVNVVVFAVGYWLWDSGGYLARAERHHADWNRHDFLFPSQQADSHNHPQWRPNIVDYVFLAFCTSTALSPADTGTLSRRAKCVQMVQAIISLVVMAIVIARAVNIFPTR